MSLLELKDVCKRGREGGASGCCWPASAWRSTPESWPSCGRPNARGCSTLLRIAAGVEGPDSGTVLFGGHDLARDGERLRGVQIGYVHRSLRGGEGRSVLSLVAAGLLAHGISPSRATDAAHAALYRSGAEHCAALSAGESAWRRRACESALARTLALQPRLVVIEEPIDGVSPRQRDHMLGLLRSLANEGITVLAGTADATGLTGADRTLSLDEGHLTANGKAELAPVLALRRANA